MDWEKLAMLSGIWTSLLSYSNHAHVSLVDFILVPTTTNWSIIERSYYMNILYSVLLKTKLLTVLRYQHTIQNYSNAFSTKLWWQQPMKLFQNFGVAQLKARSIYVPFMCIQTGHRFFSLFLFLSPSLHFSPFSLSLSFPISVFLYPSFPPHVLVLVHLVIEVMWIPEFLAFPVGCPRTDLVCTYEKIRSLRKVISCAILL